MITKVDKIKAVGTSYHRVKISTSYDKLYSLLGEPNGNKSDKTVAEWVVEAEVSGKLRYFAIYDYKQDNFVFEEDINWHISSADAKNIDEAFKEMLIKELNKNG